MFHSSRSKDEVRGSEAIINGLAKDGGLYVIDDIPDVDYHQFLNMSYQEVAATIISKYFTEFSKEEIYDEVLKGYADFDIDEVVSLAKCDNFYFLELFHGPTLAFKDLALSVMPRLMALAKKKLGINKNITILTATSGDTGSAALNGFKNIDGINIIVLYPNNGVSINQEKIMLNYQGGNAHVLAVNGNFDDCQTFLKKFINSNPDLNLSTANSINIARLIPQIVYYYMTYLMLLQNGDIKDNEEISFVVPTGNFGNIFAGFLAKNMGLPIKNLVCASNSNDVLYDYFKNGVYDRNRPFYKTNSPSMDILTSSNFERFVYYGLKDTTKVKNLMNELSNNGKYEYHNPYNYFYGYKSTDEEVLKNIKSLYDEYNYLIDPHTACGYTSYLKYKESNNEKVVILSTASIFKFPDTILKAFGKQGDIEELEAQFNISRPESLKFKDNDKEVVELKELENYLYIIIKGA